MIALTRGVDVHHGTLFFVLRAVQGCCKKRLQKYYFEVEQCIELFGNPTREILSMYLLLTGIIFALWFLRVRKRNLAG